MQATDILPVAIGTLPNLAAGGSFALGPDLLAVLLGRLAVQDVERRRGAPSKPHAPVKLLGMREALAAASPKGVEALGAAARRAGGRAGGRSLVERVEVHPRAEPDGAPRIELVGEITAMLRARRGHVATVRRHCTVAAAAAAPDARTHAWWRGARSVG